MAHTYDSLSVGDSFSWSRQITMDDVPVGEEVTIEVKVAEKIERHGHVKVRMYAYCNGKMSLGGEAVVIPPPADEQD